MTKPKTLDQLRVEKERAETQLAQEQPYVAKADDDLTPRTKENLTLEELMKTWMAKFYVVRRYSL